MVPEMPHQLDSTSSESSCSIGQTSPSDQHLRSALHLRPTYTVNGKQAKGLAKVPPSCAAPRQCRVRGG